MKYFAAVVSLAAFAAVLTVPAPTVADQAAAKEYVLAVEGMSCPTGCVPKVREALESVDGVESVQVNFESAQAVIKMQPGKDLTVEACDKSFGNQGYFVSAIEEKRPATADAGS